MKALLEGHQLDALGLLLGRHLIAARQLERRLVGLRPRVAEEGAPAEGPARQRLDELQLRLDIVEVGDVNQAAGLRGDGVRQAGVTMPQHRHRDAGRHVEVAAPLDIEERAPFSARHDHGGLTVVVEEQAAPPLDEIVLLRHRPTLLGARPRARADQQDLAGERGERPSVSKSGACAMVSNAYVASTMKPAPIIVRTATAVPGHSATQAQVKERLRALLPLPGRKLDAVMELFDHTAVERRFSVEPLSMLGDPRGLGEVQRLYRDNAIALGKKVAAEALAGAGVAARDIDLIVTTSCTGIIDPLARRAPLQRAGVSRPTSGGCRSPRSAARAGPPRWRAPTTSWSGFPRPARWWWPSSCRA